MAEAASKAPVVRSAEKPHKPGGQHPMKTGLLTQQHPALNPDGTRPEAVAIGTAPVVEAAAAPVAPAPAPAKAPILSSNAKAREAAIRVATAVNNRWAVTADQGTTPEDLLRPEYWSNVSHRRFAPFDEVYVRFEDGSYWAHLLVLACSAKWAKMEVLHEVRIEESAVNEIEYRDHKVRWAGGVALYRVIRMRDNADLKSGFSTAGEAMAWLQDHLRSMAA